MCIFYKTLAESVFCFAAICWGSSIKETEQTDEEGWLCAGDCSGEAGDDSAIAECCIKE